MQQQVLECYDMTNGSFGQCFIFNCEDFQNKDGTLNLEKHLNGSTDKERIRSVFSLMGYNVLVFHNPEVIDFQRSLTQFAAEDHKQENSFVCFILSHGGEGNTILTSDGNCIQLEKLIDLVDVEDLKGKPKLFVVETCRGSQRDRGETTHECGNATQETSDKPRLAEDNVSRITTRPDYLIVFPTSPNYVCWCNGHYGSWFIDMLTTVIRKCRDQITVTEMLQRLTFSVNCLPIKHETTWYLQVPCYTSTMRKPLCLSRNVVQTNSNVNLEIIYTEEECYRSRIQALLQHAAEKSITLFDSEDDTSTSIRFSDYSYLIEENTGYYDTRQSRVCIVVNANTDETAFSKGQLDVKKIEEAMIHLKFSVQIFQKGKKETHIDLLKKLESVAYGVNRTVSCLFLFILSGTTSFKGERKELNEIVSIFKNEKKLLNKPKVFVLQAYKSTDSTCKYPTDSSELDDYDYSNYPLRYSIEADVLVLQSCSEGCFGESKFLKIFCKYYKMHGENSPILDLIVEIIPRNEGENWNSLKPYYTSSLKHHLVLKDSFTEFKSTDDIKRKTHIDNLKLIASKLLTRIEIVSMSPSITTETRTFSYKDILSEEDETLKKIQSYRQQIASDYLAVVAIDFGTTFSGFAWSMRNQLEKCEKDNDPTAFPNICINPTWNSSSPNLLSYKTPTSILLDSEKTFKSFGYDAENDYAEIASDGRHQKFYFFQRFKMALHEKYMMDKDKRLSGCKMEEQGTSFFLDKLMIKDMNGKELPAEEVFSKSIKALVTSFTKMFKRDANLAVLRGNDIKWVLTVPAIWSEQSKQFMRKCARLAGIPSDSLSIALEPECASVYCQRLTSTHWKGVNNSSPFRAGKKYMVVDLGGGTVDIAVHQIIEELRLKEVYRSTGSNCGGTSIDNAFLDALKNMFDKDGKSVMEKMKRRYPEEYLEMFRSFESKKRTIKTENQKDIKMVFPVTTLSSLCEEVHNKSIDEVMKDSDFHQKISMKGDRLLINSGVFAGFFTPTLDKILALLESIPKKEEMSDLTDIVLVGGFAECGMLQDKIRSTFEPRRHVLVPLDCGLAVLKGAVIYGHTPSCIAVRLLRYTYGVDVTIQFDETCHSKKHLIELRGMKYCRDVFQTLIEKNTEVQNDQIVTKQFKLRPGQERVAVKIYMSTDQSPDYIDHTSCCLLGQLIINISNPIERERMIDANFMFGGTEVKVTVTDRETGEIFLTSIEMVAE